MLTEIDAYDGGQKYRIKLGEQESVSWRLANLNDGETLSSASTVITGTAVTAVQTNLTSPDVTYRVTAAELGIADLVISLNTSNGDVKKHLLVFEVFA